MSLDVVASDVRISMLASILVRQIIIAATRIAPTEPLITKCERYGLLTSDPTVSDAQDFTFCDRNRHAGDVLPTNALATPPPRDRFSCQPSSPSDSLRSRPSSSDFGETICDNPRACQSREPTLKPGYRYYRRATVMVDSMMVHPKSVMKPVAWSQ